MLLFTAAAAAATVRCSPRPCAVSALIDNHSTINHLFPSQSPSNIPELLELPGQPLAVLVQAHAARHRQCDRVITQGSANYMYGLRGLIWPAKSIYVVHKRSAGTALSICTVSGIFSRTILTYLFVLGRRDSQFVSHLKVTSPSFPRHLVDLSSEAVPKKPIDVFKLSRFEWK